MPCLVDRRKDLEGKTECLPRRLVIWRDELKPPDLTLVGAYGSPYSIKMRAVLRYRHIAYRWVVRNSAQDQGLPEPTVAIIPVLVFHEGDGGDTEALVDS